MRRLSLWTIIALLAASCLTGCPEEDTGPGITPGQNNTTKTDMGSDMGQTTQDMGQQDMGQTTQDMGEQDMGQQDMGATTGELSGSWEVKQASDDALVTTLTLTQEAGAEAAVGTFKMADGEEGNLTATFTNDTFAASWNVAGGDDAGLHQLNMGVFQGDDALNVKYISPSGGGLAVDAVMSRKAAE